MARPIKTGIDYFPLDVNNDSKLNSLVRKYGAQGYGAFIGLLQKIYSEGYYIKVDDEFFEDFCAEFDLDEDFFPPFLAFLLRRKFFDEDLFNTEKVITSRGIQKRFIEATKRRKESAITHYNLINVNNEVVNVSNNSVSVNAMQHNVSNSTQSKVNKSKLNKSKLKDTDYPFELFWNMYDKKTGKEKCQKKYEKLNEKTRELIFEHVLKYIEAQPNKQYRKNPETYLNQKAWNDEIIINNQTTGQTFAQQQMIRQSTKGVSTREQVIEASKHDNTTLEDLP